MTRWLAVAVVLAGCAPRIDVAARCALPDGTAVEVQRGALPAYTPKQACEFATWNLAAAQHVYQARWGMVNRLVEEGWTVRVVLPATLPTAPAGWTTAAHTYFYERFVDVSFEDMQGLPHELHHVQLGPGSDGHEGWCIDWEPWSKSVLGRDESEYLGCTH